MIKTDKNFKLSRRAKCMIALMGKTNEGRSTLKRMFIDAEASGADARRQALKSKVKDND